MVPQERGYGGCGYTAGMESQSWVGGWAGGHGQGVGVYGYFPLFDYWGLIAFVTIVIACWDYPLAARNPAP